MQSLENYGLDYSTGNLDTFSTLVDLLYYRAQYQPDKQAYIFLQDGETESGVLTYGELDRQARAIAAHLQSWQGERALLLYPSGLEFITAFFGCLYAGVVAVPVYPPRRNQKLSRLLSIANDAQAKLALTTTSILADIDRRWERESELLNDLKWFATDTLEADPQEEVLGNIREAVTAEHSLQVYTTVLIKTGSIPKTSSGKIQRYACRTAFLNGSLNVLGDWSLNPQGKAKFGHLQADVESLLQKLQARK